MDKDLTPDQVAGAILEGAEGALRIRGVDLSHRALSAILPTQARCCEGCAFRVGSPERSDPYGWMRLTDRFEDGEGFLCHEGIPGHYCQKPGEPLRLCAGRAALDGRPMYQLALIDAQLPGGYNDQVRGQSEEN